MGSYLILQLAAVEFFVPAEKAVFGCQPVEGWTTPLTVGCHRMTWTRRF